MRNKAAAKVCGNIKFGEAAYVKPTRKLLRAIFNKINFIQDQICSWRKLVDKHKKHLSNEFLLVLRPERANFY
ncbi:MAG: hypothetical protein COV69_03275 [Parcubacteria group bacterium CG11_big_fil_rev_8_21_14_0_20_39_14]|nr:MAG: hypothetical protein COV69_03275 [Parcubacteria group bacterium CG11_big_fil_rev_8_21_14_0_20_39_14]PIS35514.1 MAG: hypothetical protein COT36_01990 [Parcubacteria group bacterium CG08_land_8_20_14_0_20_38_56]